MSPSQELKARLRPLLHAGTAQDWRVRLHRAISWLERSEREGEDLDARFVFQWIALNAVYARDFVDATERERWDVVRLAKATKVVSVAPSTARELTRSPDQSVTPRRR